MKHILIADDRPANRYLLTTLLEGYGYRVTQAADGQEALAAALADPPDLIISDLLMPRMDGFELCRTWKADRRLCNAPFIVYTATYTEPADEALALQLGTDRFLVKPQPIEVLLGAVRACLVEGAPVARAASDAEAELRAHNAALMRKLEQKIQLLEAEAAAREQLQSELRAAQRLEALGRLACGIAHDFNNLLTVMQVYTEFVRDTFEEGEPERRDLNEVLGAASRGAALTRQLLAFGRKQALAPAALDLNHLVSDLERMLRRLLGDDIRLDTRLDPSLKPVFADPTQIEQVLMNLALNARDAMPHGGRLTFSTEARTLPAPAPDEPNAMPAGDYALVTVADDGEGMAPATLERVFEPFYTTKPAGKGTGLGLAIVHGIVHQSGGRLQIRSTPKQGTQIMVWLPVLPSAMADASEPDLGAEPSQPLQGARILLVEDEAAVRHVAERILRSAGYAVEAATDGADALRRFAAREADFDLLLTDVNMPEISGLALAGSLRGLAPRLRVLLMSGNPPPQAALSAAGLTEVPFLGKPFTAPQLKERVRALLNAEA